jgi:hypothetical protein
MRRAALGLLILFGTSAVAQDADPSTLSLDLNGDGIVEVFTLLVSETGEADLRISETGGNDVYAAGIGSTGPGADRPVLAIRGDGQVTITSHHDAVGAIRWSEVLTLGFPDGTYRITAYSYVWWSESDLESFGYCELDLRSGKGTVEQNGQPRFDLLTDIPALPATMWASAEKVMPMDCP